MQLPETVQQRAFLALAAVHLGLGLWMALSPHTFYTTIGAFGAYNRHYERDTATFYLAFALGAAIAAHRPAWRMPVLVLFTAQYALHTLNHAVDAGRANNGWAGGVDVASLALATVQFAAVLWLLRRPAPEAAAA
jgi:hypothetical protein